MLAYALKMIEGYWNEMQQMRSIGHDPESDLAFQQLEKAILEGGGLASRFLTILDPFPDQIAEPASALASVRVSVRKVTADASACERRC